MKTPSTFRALCPRCGGREIHVPAPDATLEVIRDDDGARLAVVVMNCGEGHTLPVYVRNQDAIDAILRSDVVVLSAAPPEIFDPARATERPVFTLDDLIDFHLTLEGIPTSDAQ